MKTPFLQSSKKSWLLLQQSLRSFVSNKPRLALLLVIVSSCHLFFFIYAQVRPKPVVKKTPMIVKTITLPPSSNLGSPSADKATIVHNPKTLSQSLPSAKKTSKTTTSNKSTSTQQAKKTIPSSKSKQLLKDLQENMAKMETTRNNSLPAKTITVPKPITALKADAYEIQSEPTHDDVSLHEESSYKALLIEHLKCWLHLPAYGTVKIELTLEKEGHLKTMRILSSDSEVNRLYLENALQELIFPSFTEDLSGKKEYSFFLTFCSN